MIEQAATSRTVVRKANVAAGLTISRFGRLILMAILAIAFITPLVWMISASLKTEADISAHTLALIPEKFVWSNYAEAFVAIRPFLLNSVQLAVVNVVGVLIIGSLAGYGFARLRFPGRDLAFLLVLATAIIPGIVLLIPQYIIFQRIGWVDTQLPLWVPRVMTPVFGTFLLRQAFMSLPSELEDAAKIDGVGVFGIFARIMLPQVKPALAAVAVFTFIESWNDLFGPLIFINSTNLQTLPIALAQFSGEYFSTTNLLMAASTITVIPVLVVFVLAQKYFVQGVASSGLK
ncbi:carbohydrate ABC transporter permease [Microlunatus soli]|uniref:Carbohydrate ABC transporter membrane protein 2, CUT1 family n=1 Tax=Microlunatus soli TaxID=630515 RepID=A0A1H1QLU6_9ACTN|nr:carbohydrate ABC transporter permease [Microlunatus soli]SDS23869.1 carbohydrate ABC transporter membrane protein 2, CUT1 family [Microlunatus soli]